MAGYGYYLPLGSGYLNDVIMSESMKYERDRLSAWIIKIAIALSNKAVFLPVHVHVCGLTWKVPCDHTPLHPSGHD